MLEKNTLTQKRQQLALICNPRDMHLLTVHVFARIMSRRVGKPKRASMSTYCTWTKALYFVYLKAILITDYLFTGQEFREVRLLVCAIAEKERSIRKRCFNIWTRNWTWELCSLEGLTGLKTRHLEFGFGMTESKTKITRGQKASDCQRCDISVNCFIQKFKIVNYSQ